MEATIAEGRVMLNAEGRRYTALFWMQGGVLTVTSGSVSAAIALPEVDSAKSAARTLLKTMVTEGRASDRLSQTDAECRVERPKRFKPRRHTGHPRWFANSSPREN